MNAPVQLAPESIEAIAQRVAELVRAPEAVQFIDAAEVSRRFHVSRDYVYEHADELGAVRLGEGSRPRLRFDVQKVTERFGLPPSSEPQRENRSAVRRPSTATLLPIKGDTPEAQAT